MTAGDTLRMQELRIRSGVRLSTAIHGDYFFHMANNVQGCNNFQSFISHSIFLDEVINC